MSHRSDKILWCPPVVLRFCVLFGGMALFFGASTLFEPRLSTATPPSIFPSAKTTTAKNADALLNPNAATGAPFIAPKSNTDPAAPRAANPFDPNQAPIFDDNGNVLLGHLVGPSDYVIWIYSGPLSPLYTVVHKTRGVLTYSVELDDLYRQYPELNVQNLRMLPADLRTGSPLMLADPAREQLP